MYLFGKGKFIFIVYFIFHVAKGMVYACLINFCCWRLLWLRRWWKNGFLRGNCIYLTWISRLFSEITQRAKLHPCLLKSFFTFAFKQIYFCFSVNYIEDFTSFTCKIDQFWIIKCLWNRIEKIKYNLLSKPPHKNYWSELFFFVFFWRNLYIYSIIYKMQI